MNTRRSSTRKRTSPQWASSEEKHEAEAAEAGTAAQAPRPMRVTQCLQCCPLFFDGEGGTLLLER